MKFGAQLQENIFPPWRLAYIQYDVLKTELKIRQLDHQWSDQDEKEFVTLLDNELEKVYQFITAKLGEVEARISYCERTIQTFMNNLRFSSEQGWQVMNEALTDVLFDINDLAKFTRINYTGFQKIIKKHDKWTGRDLQRTFVSNLREKPLDNQRFDIAIVFVSALHDICRRRGKPRTGNAAAGGDQNAFERETNKYWIHPDNITEVQSIIMLHLPILIFNKDKPYERSDSAISSVYFDNDDFDLYTGRLQRDEGAEAIRFRWYGSMDSSNIFIERKTHHAPWLNGASIKDRFRLDVSDVPDFISGKLTADEIAKRLEASGMDPEIVKQNHFIASGIQQSFREKRLKPICRVFYNRTAFQLPGDARVRISLDTDLTFIREDDMDGQARRGPNEWRRPDVGIDYPFRNLNPSEMLRFPYAVLETKIQTHLGQKRPGWLDQLLKSHLVHEVPRFSKYLHGASYLYRDRIPLLPWWLSEMEIDIRKPKATNFGLSRSLSFKPLIDGQYRRAMEAEEQRMNVVARAASIRSGREGSPSESEESTLEEKDRKPEEKPTKDLAPQGSYDPRCSAAVDTLVDPEQKNDHSATRNRSVSSIRHDDDDDNSFEQQHPSATVVSVGAAPVRYGTPPPAAPSAINEKALGEEVDVSDGDILVDTSRKQVLRKRNSGSSRLPRFWERIFCWGAAPLTVKDPENKNAPIPLKKIKVEPKVFFANERTFISWLQFCALLLTVALSLLNFGDRVSRIAGGIFIGISAAVAIYALYRFEKRAWMINRRVIGRYDDLWGPAVLCCLLVGALIVNFYLRFH